MELISVVVEHIRADPASFALEMVGAVSGLLCVWLLVRESIWTWPLGLLYAIVSLFIFYGERLYSDWVLHLYYVGMNAYGWYYWTRGPAERTDAGKVPIVRLPMALGGILVAITAGGIVVWGLLIENLLPDADLVYWDSTTTIVSFTAMWLTARKYIESWAVWLAVDILLTGIYLYKGILPYAVLYGIYIVMAVWGWMAWSRNMRESSTSPAAAV